MGGDVSPSSTKLKVLGDRPAVVNENACAPFGAATFTTVTDAGKTTAEEASARSWLPPPETPFGSVSSIPRMWNGDPEMAAAEFPLPQSTRLAMWPPQARTGFVSPPVK